MLDLQIDRSFKHVQHVQHVNVCIILVCSLELIAAALNSHCLCDPVDGTLIQVFSYLLSLPFHLGMMQQLHPEKRW